MTHRHHDPAAHAVDMRYAWQVLSVSILGVLMVFAGTTSVNVALPAISRELHSGPGVADWYLLSYMLSNTVLILVCGRISDLVGRRKLYLLGLMLMTLASVACALAQSPAWLISMRVLQGVAAAAVVTNINAQLADAFPPRLLSLGLGLTVMGTSVAGTLGPSLGGALVAHFGWRSVFLINVPFGLAGLIWGSAVLRPGRAHRTEHERFDVAGAVLSVVALLALLFAINRVSSWGVTDPRVLAAFAVSVAMFALFGAVERRSASPLIDFSLVTDRSRGFAYCAVFCMSIAQSTIPVVVVLHEELIKGASAAAAGLTITPFAAAVAATAPFAGKLTGRLSTRALSSIGAGVMSAGLLAMVLYFASGGPDALLFAALLMAGVGNGMFGTPNIAAIMSSVPETRHGIANGIRSVLFNSAQSIGTAVMLLIVGSWLSSAGATTYAAHLHHPSSVTPGFVIAGITMSVCTLLCGLFSWITGGPVLTRHAEDAGRDMRQTPRDANGRHRVRNHGTRTGGAAETSPLPRSRRA